MIERFRMAFGTGVLVVAVVASGAIGDEPAASLALQDSEASPADQVQPAEETAFDSRVAFSEGSWTFQTYGSTLGGDDDKGHMSAGHVGFGYYFADGWSVNLEAFGGAVRSETDRDVNGGVGGLDLLGRWHFVRKEGWSLYTDGGAGIQQATTDFPSDSRFNFRLMTGVGATYRIGGNARLMGGARYMHISNAGISEGNDGYDGGQFYAGLIFSF